MSEMRLLTAAGNYAVVQLPGRQYPGVVFQGDSLNSILSSLKEMRTLLKESRSGAALDEGNPLDDVIEICDQALNSYIDVCKRNGIPLPF